MYAMRGFGLSGEQKYRDDAADMIKEINVHIEQGEELADKSPHLIKLVEQLKNIKSNVSQYEKFNE